MSAPQRQWYSCLHRTRSTTHAKRSRSPQIMPTILSGVPMNRNCQFLFVLSQNLDASFLGICLDSERGYVQRVLNTDFMDSVCSQCELLIYNLLPPNRDSPLPTFLRGHLIPHVISISHGILNDIQQQSMCVHYLSYCLIIYTNYLHSFNHLTPNTWNMTFLKQHLILLET